MAQTRTHPTLRLRTRLDSQGRLVIPAEIRKALEMEPGTALTLRVVDGELRIMTVRESIRRVQEMVKKVVPPGRSLSEELIAERREEAKRE